jgi:hypothetical protein
VETHLVECDGELLVVSVCEDVGYSSDVESGSGFAAGIGGDARAVEVHRVEWQSGGAVRLVPKVDWNAQFLGRNCSLALSPEEFPACRVNCVYLVDRQGHPDGLVWVVDMESPWARREETICPGDGWRGSPAAVGWARRGWFFPHY